MSDKTKHIRVDEIPTWVDPMLYTWTTQAVHRMAGVWFLLLIPVIIMVDSVALPRLHIGLLYAVQPFIMYTVLSKQVSVLDTGDRTWDLTRSAAPYVTINTAATAVVVTWWRILWMFALAVGDFVFLGFKVVKCFGATGCSPNGTLYAVVLLFVLAQALLCMTMGYLLLRMPFSPTVWLRNPATLVSNSSFTPAGKALQQSRIIGRNGQ